MGMREEFEAAVIKRMKESGFLEIEIRVECLGRSGDGYEDPSVDAYWHFWQESRATLVIHRPPLPEIPEPPEFAMDDSHMDAYHAANRMRDAYTKAVMATGVKVAK